MDYDVLQELRFQHAHCKTLRTEEIKDVHNLSARSSLDALSTLTRDHTTDLKPDEVHRVKTHRHQRFDDQLEAI